MNKRVIHIGPGLNQPGGMTSVQAFLLSLPFDGYIQSHVSTFSEGSAAVRLAAALRGLAKIALSGWSQDLAHVHVSFNGSVWRKMAVTALLRAYGVPYVIHAHGSDFAEFWDEQRARQGAIRRWLNSAACVIVLSSSWKRFYADVVGVEPGKIRVVPNAVKTGAARKAATRREVVIVSLGRLCDRKGTWDLIDAFGVAAKSVSFPLRLVLAGDGELEKARALVASHDLHGVEIAGWLDERNRNELLAEADIFALPSYREGVPVAILEAQAAGLPVITCPVGGIPEIITQGVTGVMVPPGDKALLAEAIRWLAADSVARHSIGKAARERVAVENSESRVKSDLQGIYDGILARKQR
ncbi:hypothetical protein SLNSH_24165 [Alsobacter soli]|uniref:Glycosyltransferase subfamily 4-like N-terminal domain-containing protein n=1 Tax=Alsobacter soli TaxID=2109933 RepID=A0A2T1HL99_9HYPH|nr:glycosyltransferase family 4 protein [Alsobacter soli]PSC02427.1 hypothetical protein SLNSH_24165 [Alsobacter soli]